MKQLAVILLIALLTACSHSDDDLGGKAKKGKNIVETGELAAISSQSFVLNRMGRRWWDMRIIGILEHGEVVHAGDSIIQLDLTDVKKYVIDQESQLELQQAALEKMIVNHDTKLNDLNAGIKNAQASYDMKKTELEASRFEPVRTQQIKQLEFEQEKIRLAKEQKKMELARIINANELKKQEITVRQIQDDIRDAFNMMDKFTIRTPIDGIFQIANNQRTNTMYKIGDVVSVNNRMASVPDLTSIKVNTYISETDFLRIREGQKVAVRLDAMPNVVFDGEICYIGKFCYRRDSKTKQKTFDVEVKILNNDLRLKPGMTVSCEYLTD